jgi:glutamate 5-kinase
VSHPLFKAKRLVVKIGTNALTHSTGKFHRAHFEKICRELKSIAAERELVIVTSGAIALGVEKLKMGSRPKDIPGKQACAAVGQSLLMRAWQEGLTPRTVAQVLLTHSDMQNRRRYLNARHAIERMMALNVIPVINENDTVSVDEIKFGDNDTLAGLVAGLCSADALIILSDVDGLFSADPRLHPHAQRIGRVEEVTPNLFNMALGSSSHVGTGGMATKIRSAMKAMELGIHSFITLGDAAHLRGLMQGEDLGTHFVPQKTVRSARDAWIAHALKPQGIIHIDAGAEAALRLRKKSLLCTGIVRVEGSFAHGDAVDIQGPTGLAFARGLAAYSADELTLLAGKTSHQIESVLGYRGLDEAIHRDDLGLLSPRLLQEPRG